MLYLTIYSLSGSLLKCVVTNYLLGCALLESQPDSAEFEFRFRIEIFYTFPVVIKNLFEIDWFFSLMYSDISIWKYVYIYILNKIGRHLPSIIHSGSQGASWPSCLNVLNSALNSETDSNFIFNLIWMKLFVEIFFSKWKVGRKKRK